MNHYFAIIDDSHDVKNPLTVVRVVEGAGPYGVNQLNDDAAWVRTTLLDQIEAGEVPYRVQSITPKAAARIRKRREKKSAFRYFLLVNDADPNDTPQGLLREWEPSGGGWPYAETYTRDASGNTATCAWTSNGAATSRPGSCRARRPPCTRSSSLGSGGGARRASAVDY